jgi:hypothetical protein
MISQKRRQMNERQNSRFVSLPADIYTGIEERLESTGFHSVDDYVVFVLCIVEELQRAAAGKYSITEDSVYDEDGLKATVISVLEML